MIKNTAGQHIGFEMLSKAESTMGDPVTTGTPVVYVTGDGGTQAVGTGTSTHKGNGEWDYAPTQAETNFESARFLMTITDAFSQIVNVYFTYPQTGDAFTAVGGLQDVSISEINTTVDTALVDYGANTVTPPTVTQITADMDANSTQLATILTDLQSGGYENGMIWIDTVNGYSGSTLYERGTVTKPVNNWADALLLSTASGLDAFFLVGPSSIALTGASDGWRFYGKIYSVDLNGQSVSGTYFDGGAVTGNDDGANTLPTIYENCVMNGQTLGQYVLRDCKVSGNMTFAESGEYDHHGCSFMGDAIQIDYGAAVGNVTAVFHGCAGNISILNMDAVPNDVARVAGIGEVGFAASCVGGNAYISGVLKVTDSSGGLVSIDSDADIVNLVSSLNNVSAADVVTSCGTALTTYDGPTKAELDAAFTEVKGAGFIEADNSLEAIRDRGDVAWLTGAGGSSPTVAEIVAGMDADSTQLAVITSRLSAARAVYLDKLNVAGTLADSSTAGTYKADISALATSAEITAIDLIIDAINAKTTNLPADPASQAAIVPAIIAGITEGSLDLQEIVRIMYAILVGLTSGGGTGTLRFRDADDTKDRVVSTVDANSNRVTITVDGS